MNPKCRDEQKPSFERILKRKTKTENIQQYNQPTTTTTTTTKQQKNTHTHTHTNKISMIMIFIHIRLYFLSRFGRKKAILASLVIYFVTTLGIYLSPNLYVLIIIKAFNGIATHATFAIAITTGKLLIFSRHKVDQICLH